MRGTGHRPFHSAPTPRHRTPSCVQVILAPVSASRPISRRPSLARLRLWRQRLGLISPQRPKPPLRSRPYYSFHLWTKRHGFDDDRNSVHLAALLSVNAEPRVSLAHNRGVDRPAAVPHPDPLPKGEGDHRSRFLLTSRQSPVRMQVFPTRRRPRRFPGSLNPRIPCSGPARSSRR